MYHLFKRDERLSNYSTFGIGGPIRYCIEVREVGFMQDVICFANAEKMPYLIVGKGSNALFSDGGFDGLVIINKIDFFEHEPPGFIHVGAGFSFSLLGTQTAKKGLSGLEFAAGIPASVGGAVFMNAGAQGGETADTLVAVDFVDRKGVLRHLKREELHFSYRTSSFQSEPEFQRGAILSAQFKLSCQEFARKRQIEMLNYRIERQPYSNKSCGCIFRNPPGLSAGMLIEKSGLKGFAVGGAEVSDLHANFIVNKGGATAVDVLQLIDAIKKRVYDEHGVLLESEIRIINEK